MSGISNNIMWFLKQNYYPHHTSHIDIFEEWYKTGIHQSDWYVFGICQKKDNAVYKSVNTGFGIWLVYESHRNGFLWKLQYNGGYMKKLV